VFTVFWGMVAIGFALFANLSENLIQATNIIGSIFYGVILGMFWPRSFSNVSRGPPSFSARSSLKFSYSPCYFRLGETITYLWYNVIGCGLCLALAGCLQAILGRRKELAS